MQNCSVFEKLLHALSTLRDIYEELLLIAREKQALLTKPDDLDALKRISERESQKAAQAQEAERVRIGVSEALSDQLGLSHDLTLYELSGALVSSDKARLIAAAETLVESLRLLKEQNEINRQLIEIKMSYHAFILDAFAHQQEGPGNLYGISGQESVYEGDISRLIDSEV